MKRMIATVLALILMLTLAACGGETASAGKLSKDWKDFTFELDGHVYQLPCALQEFLDNGFIPGYDRDPETYKLESGKVTSIDPEMHGSPLWSNGKIGNFTNDAKVMKDCMVYEFTLEALDFPDLKLANKVSIQSTVEEFQAAFGAPTEITTGDDYTTLRYEVSVDVYMRITVRTDTSRNDVTLCNYTD